MILREIRSYLEQHRRATLGDLALHFDIAPEAMRGMIETWVAKGRVRVLDVAATCNGSCPMACADSAMTIYEWIGRREPIRRMRASPVVGSGASGSACRRAG